MPSPSNTSKMISAADLRAVQTKTAATKADEDARKEAEFTARFKTATDKYYDTIMTEVKLAVEAAKTSRRTFFILDADKLTASTDGFKYTSMLYGFWNKDTRRFEDAIYKKNSIQKPLERAAEELAPLGFKLENISDPNKSFRLFIRLSW